MFIITLIYKKPIEVVDKYLAEHRAYLDEGYKKNLFIASGPKSPRTGGIIISQIKTRPELEAVLSQDPFAIHDIADFEIIEFNPIKYHQNFSAFISG